MSLRRGACPGLLDPMPTGDGLLARLIPAGGTISLGAFAGVCAAARRLGNGVVEITARGNIQVRGLTPASAPVFADAVLALDIDLQDRVPVATPPLAGLFEGSSPDTLALAAGMHSALAAHSSLSSPDASLHPKLTIVIDGQGPLHLDALPADIRLHAASSTPDPLWHLSLGGTAREAAHLGAVASSDAVEAVIRLLGGLATRAARARDMVRADGALGLREALKDLLIEAGPPFPRPPSQPVGMHPLGGDRVALGIGLPFGSTDADTIETLIAAAGGAGAEGIRAAPDRALLIIGPAPDAARRLRAVGENLGFIVRPDDPRRHVVACAGAPACASACMAARGAGVSVARNAASLLDGSLMIHVSGCDKGCAHPAPAALTFVGTRDGCALVVDGTTRNHPSFVFGSQPPDLAPLAACIQRERRPGERSAGVLSRLGSVRLAQILNEAERV